MLSSNSSYGNLALKFLLFLLFCFCLTLSNKIPENKDLGFFCYLMIIVGIGFVIFISIKKRYDGIIHWISIYFLFILSYIIVHFQLVILELFGFSSDGLFKTFIWNNFASANKATLLSTLGILAFFMGNSIKITFKFNTDKTRNVKLSNRKHHSLFLIPGSYLFYFFFLITSGSYKSGNYAAGDQMAISNYFYFLFNTFLLAAIIDKLYFMSSLRLKGIRLMNYISLIGYPLSFLILWHILFSVYVGDRGPIITYSLLYFSLFIYRVIRINIFYLLIGATVLGSIMVVLGQTRTRQNINKSFVNRISENSSQNTFAQRFGLKSSPLTSTLELALSSRCINHSVANVPENYSFKKGFFQMRQILSAVPFASGTILKYYAGNEKKYDGSSNFISYLIQGENPKYGDGTTPVADLYLDFGGIGVILGLFLFGLICQYFDKVLIYSSSPNLLLWVCALIYFSGAFYLGRSSLLIYVQKIVPVFVVIVINHFIYYKSILR